jgi:tripartite-type tricarboxylate transporter receptor subunit TctC
MLRFVVAALVLLVLPSAFAQDYPTRPIKMIVPFPAGGPTDIFARAVGQKLQELLGQPVILDNRSGAGGVTGIDAVAKADPDGYTIGIGSAGPLAISASLLKSIPYDSSKDLAPIALVVRVPEIAVVAANVPAKTSAEFVALAKASPGKLNFASTGTGGTTHLAAELYKIKAKIDIVHVPYRGAAPAVTDVLGNQVQMMFADIPVLLEHVRAGSLKAIGAASKNRIPVLPDLPTFEEQGLPGVLADNWFGLVAPPKTPPAIIARLNKAVNDAVTSADVKGKLEPLGAAMGGGTAEEFGRLLVDERAKWADVIKSAGVEQQ